MAEIIAIVAVVTIIVGGKYFRPEDGRNAVTVERSDAIPKEEESSDTLEDTSDPGNRRTYRRPRRTTRPRTRRLDTSDEAHSDSSASDMQSRSSDTSSGHSALSPSASSSRARSKNGFFIKHHPHHAKLEAGKRNYVEGKKDVRTHKKVDFAKGDVTAVGQPDSDGQIIDSTDAEARTYTIKPSRKNHLAFSTRRKDNRPEELRGRVDGTESPMHQIVSKAGKNLWEEIERIDKEYNKKNRIKSGVLLLYNMMNLLEWFGAYDFLRSDLTPEHRDMFESNEWNQVYGAVPTFAYKVVRLIIQRCPPMEGLRLASAGLARNPIYPLGHIIQESKQLDFDLMLGFFVIPFRGFGLRDMPDLYWREDGPTKLLDPVSAAVLRWLLYIGQTMLRARMFSNTGADLLDGSIRLQFDYAPFVCGYRMNATIFTREPSAVSPLARTPEPVWCWRMTNQVIGLCKERAIMWIKAKRPNI